EIDWQVDHTNDALVDSAVRTLGVGHFGNQFEFGRLRKSCNSFARNIGLLKGNLWVMDANQLLMAREIGIIDKLPFLASDDLDDRNKQDLFLKLIAIGQTSWFTIDINVRWSRHLSVSLLELMVFAFATCTVFTYLLLLEKPNNATYTITIPATRHPRTAREITRLALAGPMVQGWPRKSIWIPNNALHLDFDMGNSKLNGARQRTIYAAAASLLIFGPIHYVERVMWHASSITTAGAIPTAAVFSMLFGQILPGFEAFIVLLLGVLFYGITNVHFSRSLPIFGLPASGCIHNDMGV
ncbi:hypothetical protein PG999_013713, partial [Apiospora kogelbergensis]